jgi:hypothetical protein
MRFGTVSNFWIRPSVIKNDKSTRLDVVLGMLETQYPTANRCEPFVTIVYHDNVRRNVVDRTAKAVREFAYIRVPIGVNGLDVAKFNVRQVSDGFLHLERPFLIVFDRNNGLASVRKEQGRATTAILEYGHL